MEIKKSRKQLEVGKIYYTNHHEYLAWYSLFEYLGDRDMGPRLYTSDLYTGDRFKGTWIADDEYIYLDATEEQTKWYMACKKAGKFVPLEKVLELNIDNYSIF